MEFYKLDALQKKIPLGLILIFAIMVCLIAVGAYFFYHTQKERITQLQYSELAAIADLKVDQIGDWRKERRVDGEVLFNSPILVDYVEQYLHAPEHAAFRTNIHQQMKAMLRHGDYSSIYLLDAAGKARLLVNGEARHLGPFIFTAAREALRTKKIIISDLHFSKTCGFIHMDIVVPLVSLRANPARAIGVVVLQIDPNRYLYQRTRSWPTPSPSGETLLVRREGADILYLNELRHKKGTALTLTLPANAPYLPSALAVRGYTGIVDGIDYRNVPVLAATRQIPGSNWFIVAKVDRSEVLAPVQRQALYIVVIALLLIISAGATLGVLWQRDRLTQYNLLLASEIKRQEEHAQADVALQKLLEDLHESEARYKSLFDTSLDCIFRVDTKGVIEMVNRAGAEMFGFQSPEEAIGSFGQELWADRSERDKFLDAIRKQKVLRGYPVKARKKTGEIIHLEVSCHVLEDEQGNAIGIEGILRDITERKALEEQLLHSQKIEAVGTLAGGVAHDFNNILTAIMGYTHVVLAKLKQDDPLHYELQQVLTAADRAAMLTQSLLAFSRKQMVRLAPIEINDLIRKFGAFLARLIREDIEINTATSDDNLIVMADKGQIEQALVNLATNAQDAMPNGGRLILESRRHHMTQAFIAAHGYGALGEYALIVVSDTGIGMDETTKQKIFEPFFTTKEVGKGTGLGLALVYGTVKKHDGFITVSSELGKGTTFNIYLPLTDKTPEEPARPPSLESAYVGGTETVLVAEDDEALRVLAASVLENAGYTVIAAEDGMDAMQKFIEHKDRIRLALLDVIMPKKNGPEVYKELMTLSPDLKVIFMSGYTERALDSSDMPCKHAPFLQKPVSPEELLKIVRSELDALRQA